MRLKGNRKHNGSLGEVYNNNGLKRNGQLLVIWFRSPKVCKTVNGKCHVRENHKSEYAADSDCFHPAFVPTVNRYEYGQNETTHYFEKPIVSEKRKRIKIIFYIEFKK